MKPSEPLLSGKYIDTFAYLTIKDRMPAILGRIVDDLSKQLHLETGASQSTKLKLMINAIGKLKIEITTDKPLPLVDAAYWKQLLENIPTVDRTWFKAPWLIVECLMYKILHDIAASNSSPPVDLFANEKLVSMESSIAGMHTLADFMSNNKLKDQDLLLKLVEFSLWGNQHDLSLNVDKANSRSTTHILVNDSQLLVENLMKSKQIGIVLDNSGFELFCDLCFASKLVKMGIIVEFHFKEFPWFVSDTTANDLECLLKFCESDSQLKSLSIVFRENIETKSWRFKSHPFWTCGNAYWDLSVVAPDLLKELKEFDLVLMKGDLNYRKLVYDAAWPSTTP